MEKETLVVASSANERFALGLAVLLCSIVLNNRNSNIVFHVMDDGILSETKQFITTRVTGLGDSLGVAVDIHWRDLSKVKMPELPPMKGSYASYARLFFSELMEESSLYYVDADIICNRPFPSLKEMEALHAGCLVAGCPDLKEYVALDKVWAAECGGGLYVNAGFVWMNLSLMRSTGFVQRVCKRVDLIDGLRRKVSPYHDQTLLNCHCHGRMAEMPGQFNVVSLSLSADDGMNLEDNWHFTGDLKPWLVAENLGPLAKAFGVYHVLVEKLGMENRLPYSKPYLPLSGFEYAFRHLMAVRLWLRSKKRFRRFKAEVRSYQNCKKMAALYAARVDVLMKS